MSVLITYFVHGTTTDNETGVATGWLDGTLSELGRAQAKELGETVSDKEFAVVFHSDLQRAIDSAELGFGGRYELVEDARLRECNYGDYNGASTNAFEKHGYIETPFPNGESYRDVESRIVDFLERLKRQYEGKHVAIVAHEAPQLALDVLIHGKTWQRAFKENWRNAGAWQPGWEYELT